LLLFATTLLTFSIVGLGLLAYRLPQIKQDALQDAQLTARNVSDLLENTIGALQTQLRPALLLRHELGMDWAAKLFGSILNEEGFQAIYLVDRRGIVHASASVDGRGARQNRLVGADLSGNTLFREVLNAQHPIWSDRYLSALKGELTVAVAYPDDEQFIIAEMTTGRLRDIVLKALVPVKHQVFVIDGQGEWVADNLPDSSFRHTHWGMHPIVTAARSGERPPDVIDISGASFYPAYHQSEKLGWLVISMIPSGVSNPDHARTLYLALLGLLASGLIGLLMAPIWAVAIQRPLRGLIRQSRLISRGDYSGSWRPSRIVEIDELGNDLGRMARAIAQRESSLEKSEKYLLELFNIAPNAMLISRSADHDYTVLDINQAWVELFAHSRDVVIGRNGKVLNWWKHPHDRETLLRRLEEHGQVKDYEASMLSAKGEEILCSVSAAAVTSQAERQVIFVYVDITDTRRMQLKLDRMNQGLELQVAARTAELRHSNWELKHTLASLKLAQDELVRSEKLAALGELVAGIAHELNTPIGNAGITLSTLEDHIRTFRDQVEQGLKRSTLDQFVQDLDSAARIALRNIQRASEMVSTFKQVAADRASSQRRRFEAKEIVEELSLIMHPTLKRTPYQLETRVPDGIELDSYPGPLSQVLTNLVNNALIHGLAGKASGKVRVVVDPLGTDQVVIRVSDDGYGIPEEMQSRIFDPFFTTKLGSGGTGLGLHILHNIVTNVLGGRVELSSAPGAGSEFRVTVPVNAPVPENGPQRPVTASSPESQPHAPTNPATPETATRESNGGRPGKHTG
jgi:PAS domain S-box-containing protein